MLGGGGMVGGVNLDCVLTSAGESGMVESFPVRSARGQQSDTQALSVEVTTVRTALHTVRGISALAERLKGAPTWRLLISIQEMQVACLSGCCYRVSL